MMGMTVTKEEIKNTVEAHTADLNRQKKNQWSRR